jgi:hypothetical protein
VPTACRGGRAPGPFVLLAPLLSDRARAEALPKSDPDEAGRGHDGRQEQRRRVPDARAGNGTDHHRGDSDYGSSSEDPPSTDREPGQGSNRQDQDKGHAVTILPAPGPCRGGP